MKRILFFIVVPFFALNLNAKLNAEIIKKPIITLEVAKKMAESCLVLAKNNEKKINIAIYESPGSLKYYASMDGTYPASEEISRLKGKTTAGLPYTTDELRDMAFSGDNPNQGLLTLPSVVLLKGGVPIILKDGTHIGGVGVSGASGGFDKNCAEKAVEIAKNIMVE